MPSSAINASTATHAMIGRYQVQKKLGSGSQGVVYLARDPDIDRQIAIKTLTRQAADEAGLLNEARNVGKLKHPNIATVFDIGSIDNTPYVVYEFICGESLRAHIAKGPIAPVKIVRWLSQMLEAMDYAHGEGIVHRDLNPNNVMIDNDGSAKVLDFGIATLSGTVMAPGDDIVGTVNYMAPEQLSAGLIGPQTDVFSLGLIAHEMLTGKRAVDLDDAMAAMYAIAHNELPAPSAVHGAVEPKFDIFVARAVAKDPSERYLSARAMREALASCACDEDAMPTHGQAVGAGSKQSTLAFLVRRMRRRSDFPAMSERITEINRQTTKMENASVNELANTILKDYALTTKLLKLVNSSFYGQYGGEISTVSRAVVILGLKHVRMVAQSLLLFDHLDDKPHAKRLKEVASQSVLSGIIGRQVAGDMQLEGSEEAFVCSMVHELGHYLTLFYLPEEYADIKLAVEHRGVAERAACMEVLGLTYEELGVGIAKEWSFPRSILATMRALPDGALKPYKNNAEALHHVTNFSTELCQTITKTPIDTRRMSELCQRYEKSLAVDEERLTEVVKKSLEDAKDFGPVISAGMETTQVFKAAEAWSRGEEVRVPALRATDNDGRTTEVTLSGSSDLVINGIQDITNALIEDCSLNDILSMVLETIYRGLGVTRVLLCISDLRQGRATARLGLGQDLDRFLGKFSIPLKVANDLFSAAMTKHVDLSYPGKLPVSKLPPWYRKLVTPRAMVLLPIVVNNACLGVIYCDIESGNNSFDATQFNYLNTLRNQAALALKQHHSKR